jgi:hypothetical protein
MSNFAKLEINEANAIFCPVCGHLIMGEDEGDKCKHVMFTYIDVVGEFLDVAPKYKEILRKIEEDEDVSDPFGEAVEKIKEPGVLFLSLTTSGVACGPVSSTACVAINFDIE